MKQMKKLLSVLLAVLMVFSLMSTALAVDTEDSMEGKIVILHSNDVHGGFAEPKEDSDEIKGLLGYARIAALRDEYVKQGAEVILADVGDFCQGTTYVSLSKGANAIEMMNAAGYDVITLGNHEFDFGYENLMTILEKAEFKTVCGDVFKDGKSILDGWTIIEKAGVKVGFVGLETPETYTKVNPALIQGVAFPQKEALYDCAQKLVDEVKAAGADIVVGLFHLGVDDESIGNRSVDVYNNVQGLDIILDGHSHSVMTPGDDGEFSALPIQSTGTKFANIGVVVIDPATKTISDTCLLPTKDIAENAEVKAKAEAIMKAVDDEYGAVFAKSEVELNGDKSPGNRNMETNLGDLITDAMVWSVLKEADLKVPTENVVGITNGGGIRAWIHAGDVTMKDINTVLPFGNTVAVIYVTGAELLEALEASCFMTPGAVGGFPQVSGIDYTIATDVEFDQGDQYPDSTYYAPKSIQRVAITDINGVGFDRNKTYAVVTNNFCAAGGDTYYAFKAASDQFDTSIPMDEALMNYVDEELGGVIGEKYAEPQGRIFIGTKDEVKVHNLELTFASSFEGLYPAACYTEESWNALQKAFEDFDKAEGGDAKEAALAKAFDAANALEIKDNTFVDVPEDAWFDPAVDFVAALDLMNGTGNNKFDPNVKMTRAMVVTVLYRYAGSPDVTGLECAFKDLTQDWYKDAVTWAAYNSITTGTSDNEFSPGAPVTREQMATFISRFLFVQGEEDMSEEFRALLKSNFYTDADAISQYAVMPVFDCTNALIMRGDSAKVGERTTFRPLDPMSRAECAQVLMNMTRLFRDRMVLNPIDTAA